LQQQRIATKNENSAAVRRDSPTTIRDDRRAERLVPNQRQRLERPVQRVDGFEIVDGLDALECVRFSATGYEAATTSAIATARA